MRSACFPSSTTCEEGREGGKGGGKFERKGKRIFVIEVVEPPSFFHFFSSCPFSSHLPLLQDNDAVGLDDSVQPVRDDERCPARHQILQGFLHCNRG